ncbi:DUF742 domain-containing protein [Streptomyces sp. NPDC101455]|uniref:DUF742 domain-containing protein n=1 Tax=Streptomyces sp. NPDC101455 TaxID=3366142 RepID=UPI0038039E67
MARAAGPEVPQLAMHSIVQARVPPTAAYGFPKEWQWVVAWTSRNAGMGVAEIAARLGMELTPTRRLLHELHVRGLVVCHAAGNDDIALLYRVKAGLEAS